MTWPWGILLFITSTVKYRFIYSMLYYCSHFSNELCNISDWRSSLDNLFQWPYINLHVKQRSWLCSNVFKKILSSSDFQEEPCLCLLCSLPSDAFLCSCFLACSAAWGPSFLIVRLSISLAGSCSIGCAAAASFFYVFNEIFSCGSLVNSAKDFCFLKGF